jgi:serine/threonine protein kinase
MKALDCPEITVDALGELGDQLGGGGVSVVYRAVWQGQPVAVKLTQEEANDALVEEYRNELQVMTQLDHPNIIRLLGASLVPPKLCIVMELCGPSLHKLVHQSAERFDHIRRLQIAQDVAEALRYLHAFEVPVIHRDIKSQNIVVDETTGKCKLIDFGLASTRVVSAGTPSYMAPELLAVREPPPPPPLLPPASAMCPPPTEAHTATARGAH